MTQTRRRPQVFRPGAATIVTEPEPPAAAPESQEEAPRPRLSPRHAMVRAGLSWGALLGAAVTGLISLAASLWIYDVAAGLMARNAWIGWLATALITLAGLAAGVLVLKEAWAIARLGKLGALHQNAETAITQADKAKAEEIVDDLDTLYERRGDIRWARANLADHRGDVMDARELLTLAERHLLVPLDAQAREVVAGAAKRVSVLTAINPAALIDILFVAEIKMRMLRQLATIYGARPSSLGLFKLARMVVSHIALTGGIALGDDMLQQLLGQKLTAKVSARLGEGVFNGALTARIGIAALAVCRPLPHIETRPLRFRDVAGQIISFGAGEKT